MFLARVLRKFFGSSETGETITVSLGAGCTFALPIEHAMKLRDTISIQIIRAQDIKEHGIDMYKDNSRTTNGDME